MKVEAENHALKLELTRAKTSIETSLATALERDALKQQRDTYRKQLFPKDGCAPNCQCNECQLKQQVEKLKEQLKEYCGEYDLMLERWKNEKGDIAARCGYPWENGVGWEPWVAADKLRGERDSLRLQLLQTATHNAKLRELVKEAIAIFNATAHPCKVYDGCIACRMEQALSLPPDQALAEWVECLKMIVESAVPHPTTNTAMFKAWEKARQLLGQNTQTPK